MFLVRLDLTLVEITEVRPVVSALYVPLVIVILRAENTNNKSCHQNNFLYSLASPAHSWAESGHLMAMK